MKLCEICKGPVPTEGNCSKPIIWGEANLYVCSPQCELNLGRRYGRGGETDRKRLILDFPDADTRHAFIATLLDGGCDQHFMESEGCENVYTQPPGGGDEWDWQKGLGHDAPEHVIEFVRIIDES